MKEGLDWLAKGLQKTEGTTELRAFASAGAATLAGNNGEQRRAMEYSALSVEYAQQLDLKIPLAMHAYAVRSYYTKDYAEACQLLETALGLLHEDNALYFRLVVLGMYADRARQYGDLVRASNLYGQVLQYGKAIPEYFEATTMANLGRLSIHERNYQRAAELLGNAVQINRTFNGRLDITEALLHLGTVQMYQGNYAASEQTLNEALTLWREIGQLDGIAHALHLLANVKLYQNADGQAIQLMQQCFSIYMLDEHQLLWTGEFSVVRLLIGLCRNDRMELEKESESLRRGEG